MQPADFADLVEPLEFGGVDAFGKPGIELLGGGHHRRLSGVSMPMAASAATAFSRI